MNPVCYTQLPLAACPAPLFGPCENRLLLPSSTQIEMPLHLPQRGHSLPFSVRQDLPILQAARAQ